MQDATLRLTVSPLRQRYNESYSMIQRLHLEEAQQPSAYAISAARESGAYKDDKENESLALEFQSLLAQITGKLAAVPDQAMAVGLALAQTIAPENMRQRAETRDERDLQDGRDIFAEQDSRSHDAGLRDDSRQVQVRDKAQKDGVQDSTNEDDQESEVERDVSADESSKESIQQDEFVGDIESGLDTTIAQVVTDSTQVDEQSVQIAQGPLIEQVVQQQVVTADTSDDGAQVQQQATVELESGPVQQQVKVALKQEKHEESEEEVEVDPSAQLAAESAELGKDRGLQIRKDGTGALKHRDSSEEINGQQRQEQLNAAADSSGRNPSLNQDSRNRRDSQDFDLDQQNQKLFDVGSRAQKIQKQRDAGDELEDFAAERTQDTARSSESNLQMMMLRHSFDSLRAHKVDGAEKAAKAQTTPVGATGAAVEAKPSQSEQSSRANSKALPRPQVAKMLERVEATLKEAARSRDGRTISLHLEPVNLGKVKVDVSLREGTLHARISPENQQVVQALREHAYELQGSLRKLGLDVETVSVSVTSENFEGEMNSGQQMFDGRSFQDGGHNMPQERAQVAENTVGNELADWSTASAETTGSAAGTADDHWVA